MKKKHNRRRYDKGSKQKAEEVVQRRVEDETGNEDLMEHMDFLMSLTEGKRAGPDGIKKIYGGFFKKWRQRGLSFWQKWCKLPEQ